MKLFPIVAVGIILGLSPVMLAQNAPLYLVIATSAQPEANRIATRLRADGYTVKQVAGDDAKVHLRLGPYTTPADREKARAALAAKGIKSVPAQADEGQSQQAGDSTAKALSADQQDAEAAALARLGLSPAKTAPQSQAEIEAEALKAMQTNTEREAAEAEKRRLAAEAAAQQAEADRLQREIAQQQAAANAPPQESTAASFLHALNGVIAAGTDAYAQQQAANQAANQARLDQLTALRAQQAQIEANRAAEQRRQQLAAQAAATASGRQQQTSSASSAMHRASSSTAGASSAGPSTVARVDVPGRYVIPTNPSGVCPPSGFIPGAFNKVADDVSVGVQCTPGETLGGTTNSSPGGGGVPPHAGGGSDGGLDPTLSKHVVSPGTLQQCVSMDFNGKTTMVGELGWDRYLDNCNEPINLTVIFANTPGPWAFDIEAGGFYSLNRSRSDHERMGATHWYACPKGYGAADSSGKYLTTAVTEYICREHGW